jgi:hypothetical protein
MGSKSQSIKQPFSNVQLELLKVFAHHVSDNDLIDLRQVLADFFSKKAVAAADAAWDKNGWPARTPVGSLSALHCHVLFCSTPSSLGK